MSVPRYTGNQFTQNQFPGVQNSIKATPADFGADLYAQQGRSMQQAISTGAQAFEFYELIKTQREDALVRDQLNSATVGLREGMNEIYNKKGKDALNAYDDSKSLLDDIKKTAITNIKGSRAQQKFNASFNTLAHSTLGNALKFQNSETEKYDIETKKAEIVEGQNLYMLTPWDNNLREETEFTVKQNTLSVFKNLPSKAASLKADEAVSNMYKSTLDGLMIKDPHSAGKYYEKYKDKILPQERFKLEDRIKNARSKKVLEGDIESNLKYLNSIKQLEDSKLDIDPYLYREKRARIEEAGSNEKVESPHKYWDNDQLSMLNKSDLQQAANAIDTEIATRKIAKLDELNEIIDNGGIPDNDTAQQWFDEGYINKDVVKVVQKLNSGRAIETDYPKAYELLARIYSNDTPLNDTARVKQVLEWKQAAAGINMDKALRTKVNNAIEQALKPAKENESNSYFSMAKKIITPPKEGKNFSVATDTWLPFDRKYEDIKSQMLYASAMEDLQIKLKDVKNPVEAEKIINETKNKYEKEISVQEFQREMYKMGKFSSVEYANEKLQASKAGKQIISLTGDNPEAQEKVASMLLDKKYSPEKILELLKKSQKGGTK